MTHPDFQHLRVHLPLYDALGVEGMSTDDEIGPAQLSSRRGTVLTFRKAYLSIEVSKLNMHLDEIHERRLGPTGYFNPAPRIPKACPRWILRLPFNVYDAATLTQITPEERQRLQVTPSEHPFIYHTGPL